MRSTALAVVMMSALLGSVSMSCSRNSTTPAEEPEKVAAEFQQGRKLYEYWCSTCHGAGVGAEGRAQLPGTAALQEKYQGELPAVLEERTDLTPEIVSLFVRNGVSVMPFFRKTEISDEELAQISAYLTRPRSNSQE